MRPAWDLAWEGGSYGGKPLPGLKDALRSVDWGGKEKIATRSAGQKAMAAMAPFVPTLVGGAADLSESTKTEFPGGDDERYTKAHAGRNVFWGVREHGMGGVGQRACGPRRDRAALRLDVPAVRRLHARLDPLERFDGPAGRVGVHP